MLGFVLNLHIPFANIAGEVAVIAAVDQFPLAHQDMVVVGLL